MKTQHTLNITLRAQTGRSASRRLRKVNRIPAILYGKHTSPEKFSIEVPEFVRLIKSVAGRAVLIELNRDDKPEKAARPDHRSVPACRSSRSEARREI